MNASALALLALDDDLLNEYSLGELSDLLAEMRDSGELEDFVGDAFETFDEGPKEGDVNDKGLVFHQSRWRRKEDMQPGTEAQPVSQTDATTPVDDDWHNDAVDSLVDTHWTKVDEVLRGANPGLVEKVKDRIQAKAEELFDNIKASVEDKADSKVSRMESQLESRLEVLQFEQEYTLSEEVFKDDWKQRFIDDGKYRKGKYDFIEDDPDYKATVDGLYQQEVAAKGEDRLRQEYQSAVDAGDLDLDENTVTPLEEYVAYQAVGNLEDHFAEQKAEEAWEKEGKKAHAMKVDANKKKTEQLKTEHEAKVNAVRGQMQNELRQAVQTRLVPKLDEYTSKLLASVASRNAGESFQEFE